MEQDFQRTFAPLTEEERQAHLAKIQADTLAVTATTRKQEIDNEARELKALEAYSVIAHNSGMFGTSSPEQAGAMMLIAKAFGVPAIMAFQQFDIIENKPAMKAVAMQSRFQQAGGTVEYLSYTDENVTVRLSHPHCPNPVTIIASWDDCKGINGEKVTGFKSRSFTKTRDGGVKKNWADSRRSMLRSRAISEGVRATLPGVLHGLYTPEEVDEMRNESAAHREPVTTASRMAGIVSHQVESVDPGDPLAALRAELADAINPSAVFAIQKRYTEGADESIRGEMISLCTAKVTALKG